MKIKFQETSKHGENTIGTVHVRPIYRICTVPSNWVIIPEQRTMEVANKLWKSFGDIPVDDDGFTTYHWMYWSAGTDREEVWQWFEDTFRGFRVGDKMP